LSFVCSAKAASVIFPFRSFEGVSLMGFPRAAVLPLLVLFLCLSAATKTAGAPKKKPAVVLARTRAAGVNVVLARADLGAPGVRVSVALARGGPGSAERFSRMMTRTKATAGLTGTFFGTNNKMPIGDIVVGGRLAHFGGRGAALCFPRNRGGRAIMRDNAGVSRHTDWKKFHTVIAGGMWLVRRGRIALKPRAQGFRDPSLFRPAARVAVGLTGRNKLLLVATREPVMLPSWARTLRALGARDALNLDGGSSTGLFYRGRVVLRPGRRLTNALVIYEDEGPVRRTAK
jgi:hypothetical protein